MAEEMKAERLVRSVELSDLPSTTPAKGRTLLDEHNELLKNVKVRVSVSVGVCEVTVKDLLDLKEEAVLTLNKGTRDPVDVTLDGKVIARGHLVAVDDHFGVRITEIVPA